MKLFKDSSKKGCIPNIAKGRTPVFLGLSLRLMGWCL